MSFLPSSSFHLVSYPVPMNLSRTLWILQFWNSKESEFWLYSLLAENKTLASFFKKSSFISLRAGGHPLSWSLLITKQIQHLLSDVVTIFPVDVSSDPDKAASYHWSLWLLYWFLWLLPSARHKKQHQKPERKLSGKRIHK